MSSPPIDPPQDTRTVTVGVQRLARWLDGFAERHGETAHVLTGPTLALTGADGARAWIEIPYGPVDADVAVEADPVAAVVAHVTRPRLIGVVLVRRGGHAAGLFRGEELLASKVGSSYVQSSTKAGGWSQQRYARRRANQADAAFATAADAAVRVLGDAAPDALVAGGDRDAVRSVLGDRRLAHLPSPSGPWLTVKDPRQRVLVSTPQQFRAVRVRLDP